MWLSRLSCGNWWVTPEETKIRELIRKADRARDNREWATAAARYAQALAQDRDANSRRKAVMTTGRRAAICIQLGHVLREQGILDRAEAAYRESVILDGKRVKSYYWHHSINLGGLVTPDAKSRYLLSREADIVFSPLDLRDRSVLDVWAWNGYFTVEARRRGAARLLAVDDFAWTHPELRGKETFDLVMSRLGIDAESRVIDVQEMTVQAIGRWDVALFLGVFYHLLDPIDALRRLAEVTNDVLVIETHLDMQELSRPAMVLYPTRELGGDETNWWGPNRACVEGLLKAVGFPKVVFTQHPVAGPGRGFFHAFKSTGVLD